MSIVKPLNPADAEGKTKELFGAIEGNLGKVPNIFRVFGHAPAALEGFLNFSGALGGGSLTPQLREKIALTCAGLNGCDYCASAHTLLGSKAGVDEAELVSSLAGKSGDAKDQAALDFAARIIEARGRAGADAVKAVRDAGFSDEEIVEILANVALNIFTNYFNETFETENDFPPVSAKSARDAA